MFDGLWRDLRSLDERTGEVDRAIARIAQTDPEAKRLQHLRGVGPVGVTALIAAVGDGKQFSSGRR